MFECADEEHCVLRVAGDAPPTALSAALDTEPARLDTDDAHQVDLWHRRAHVESMRQRMLERYPTRLPRFTALGYRHARAAPELNAMVRHFLDEHPFEHKESNGWRREPWSDDEINVNQWEVDTYVLYVSDELRAAIVAHYHDVLAEWAGVAADELVSTSVYGIRAYTNGSILATHVDRPDTHVISSILNCGQRGVRRPWLLQVTGFDGVEASIDMQPGDSVFYESATVPHGRYVAFDGDAYFNVFTHFKTADWAERIEGMIDHRQ